MTTPREEPESAARVRAATRAIARGDRQALARFYEAWFDRTFAAARRLTGRDESFCLDVVQETMLRVIRSMKELSGEAHLNAWMERTVHSAAIDLLRKDARRALRESANNARAAASAAEVDERVQWILAQLAELPAEEAALIVMRFRTNQTLDAVGMASGLSGDAAHGRLRRAIARLRRLAKEAGHE